jgi:enterochelin esterase-like enzyme
MAGVFRVRRSVLSRLVLGLLAALVVVGPAPFGVGAAGIEDDPITPPARAAGDRDGLSGRQSSAVDDQAAGTLSNRASLPSLEPNYSQPAFLFMPGGTTVKPDSFFSDTLQRTMPYEVILPPDYSTSSRSYPVLYLLHGYGGWSHSWVELSIHQTADYLWAEQKLDRFIIVLPEGENSYFLNHAYGGTRWADYIAEDVVQEIDASYRTLADARHRAIGGLSMGADGALQIAMHNPDVFSIVGAHSPTTRLTYDQAPGFYGDEEYWEQNNPIWLINNTDDAAGLKIWVDIGKDDEWYPSGSALDEALTENGYAYQYHQYVGGHSAEYWIGNSPAYLRFYASAFRGDALGVRAGPVTLAMAPTP